MEPVVGPLKAVKQILESTTSPSRASKPAVTSKRQSVLNGGIGLMEIKEKIAGVSNSFTVSNGPPRFTMVNNGGLRIHHSEIVMDLKMTASAEYASSQYIINPGNSTLFTWLGTIADGFEIYKFHSIKFIYVPICATTEIGQIGLAFDPDAHDNVPLNKQAFGTMLFKATESVHDSVSLNIPESALTHLLKERFVRSGTGVVDVTTYDVGTFTWILSQVGTNALGTIYVEYDVELKVPEISKGTAYYYAEGTIGGTFNLGGSPLGTVVPTITYQDGSLPVDFIVDSGAVFARILRPGIYLFQQYMHAPQTAGDTVTTLVSGSVNTLTFTGGSGVHGIWNSPWYMGDTRWMGVCEPGVGGGVSGLMCNATIRVDETHDSVSRLFCHGAANLWDSTHLAQIQALADKFGLLIISLPTSWVPGTPSVCVPQVFNGFKLPNVNHEESVGRNDEVICKFAEDDLYGKLYKPLPRTYASVLKAINEEDEWKDDGKAV